MREVSEQLMDIRAISKHKLPMLPNMREVFEQLINVTKHARVIARLNRPLFWKNMIAKRKFKTQKAFYPLCMSSASVIRHSLLAQYIREAQACIYQCSMICARYQDNLSMHDEHSRVIKTTHPCMMNMRAIPHRCL